ncbi:MAG: sorting protein [Bacteroidetes bacterium]|nr:sorting protein [Bacteroidota bacterium]
MKHTFTFILSCLLATTLFAQTKQGANATQMVNEHFAGPRLRAASTPVSTLALSGYFTEGFEGATFPPTGWMITNVAGPTYTWASSTAQVHSGTKSAFMRYDATAGGGQDWLITPKYTVASTDSVVFFLRLAYAGYQPDSLSIKVSTTDSATASFTGTLLALKEGTNYPPNATAWYRYAVSLAAYNGQNIFIAFKHYDNDGDGLYIDDVAIGTKPAAEVAITALIMPANSGTGTAITPQATFLNSGSATQTFNATTTITPGGYTSTQTITSLAPGATGLATFTTWTPAVAGTYTVKSFSELTGDANHLNDTITRTVTILSSFTNAGWSTQTPLSGGRWATAPAFAKPCVSGTDTGFVYLISGGDASFANSTLTSAYNMTTGTWSNKAPIPTSRTQITPLQVNNKIYVIGGYGGSFAPVTNNDIYDVVTNTWSAGMALPQATGDYAAGVYNDSLIYIIGGYNGAGDLNNVQIYNISANTWTTGTAKIGTAVAGLRMGITGNNIVAVGGYSQTLATEIADAYRGVINPANPTIITWTALPAYPGGTVGRLGAGTTAQPNGEVYFGGGDPSGAGTAVLNTVYAYNTNTSQWETGPAMTGVSNISGLSGVIKNDTLYMVSVGGYDGVSVITTSQWLKIGPATVATVSSNTAICAGGSTVLTAANGTAYSWLPATSLDNAAIAAPTATPATTTTYTVNVSEKYGCPVPKTVTVTVNDLPTVLISGAATVCNGTSTALTASGGSTYVWTPATGLDNSGIATPMATPNTSTTYTVNVTDGNGCSNTNTVMITVNALPPADAGTDAAVCNGESIVLNGNGGTTYSWAPAASLDDNTLAGPNATPATTTTYTLTVTDGNGCTNTDTTIVTVNDLPVGLFASSNISCNGLTDGSADIGVSGTSTYSYLWSNGATTATISGLSAGAYTVTVTDDVTGCTNSVGATIVEPDALVLATTNDTTNICDGTVSVTPTGGTFGYNYSWAPGGEIIDTPTGLCPGTYTVQVTDGNGCIATATALVQSSVGVAEINGATFSTYPNPASENLIVKGEFNNVTITLTDVLGKQIMIVAENVNGNISKTINISALPAGVYYLQLKNNSGITTKKFIKQ